MGLSRNTYHTFRDWNSEASTSHYRIMTFSWGKEVIRCHTRGEKTTLSSVAEKLPGESNTFPSKIPLGHPLPFKLRAPVNTQRVDEGILSPYGRESSQFGNTDSVSWRGETAYLSICPVGEFPWGNFAWGNVLHECMQGNIHAFCCSGLYFQRERKMWYVFGECWVLKYSKSGLVLGVI